MYKLVLLDIDGTTINSKGHILKETKETIKKTIEEGVKVCLVTGRNKRAVMPIVDELELDTPVVASDGSLVIDTNRNIHLVEKTMPRDFVTDVIKKIDEENLYLEIYTHELNYKYCKNRDLKKYNFARDYDKRYMDKKELLARGVKYIEKIDEFFLDNVKACGFVFVGDTEASKNIVDYIKEKKCDEIEIRRDMWDGFIFVIPRDAKKSFGLNYLCQYYNIKKEETIAIGDQLNDLVMLQEAGLGIAMANGDAQIKNVADYITKSNDENGVGHALEKYLL